MKRDKPYLLHIMDAILDIEKFMEGITKKKFFENREKQYAVIRALEIMGEATKSLSAELKAEYPGIPWKTIAGMRDKLIHAYFGINLDRVWKAIKEDVPELKKQLFDILKGMEDA